MAAKLFNILFLAIKKEEYDFLKYRHQLDATLFNAFAPDIEVTHLKLYEPTFFPEGSSRNELFFKGSNGFFHLPLSLIVFIRRQKPEAMMIHGFVFPFQLLALRFFISGNTKIIVQHHAEKPFVNSIKRWFQKMAYSKADAYLFSSLALADQFMEQDIIRDKNKIHEVMEGSSLFTKKSKPAAREQLGIKAEHVFLWVGRLDANKDPLTVLKALKLYKDAGYKFVLYMIYGSIELEQEVKTFIKNNGLSEHIFMIGAVPHTELENWYNAADCFISASHYEGGGIAFCEAMACGCIPVVTRIASFINMTNNGSCGVLFETGNAEDLYNKLCSLDLSRKEMLSQEVIEQFDQALSFEAIGKKIKTITLNLLKQ